MRVFWAGRGIVDSGVEGLAVESGRRSPRCCIIAGIDKFTLLLLTRGIVLEPISYHVCAVRPREMLVH